MLLLKPSQSYFAILSVRLLSPNSKSHTMSTSARRRLLRDFKRYVSAVYSPFQSRFSFFRGVRRRVGITGTTLVCRVPRRTEFGAGLRSVVSPAGDLDAITDECNVTVLVVGAALSADSDLQDSLCVWFSIGGFTFCRTCWRPCEGHN